MTVAELREALEGAPDDLPVFAAMDAHAFNPLSGPVVVNDEGVWIG